MVRIIPSYGRRRSHGLSTTQKNSLVALYELYGIDLPNETIHPNALFSDHFSKIILEIGFGNGERLINHAISRQDIGFIGCDPFENGVATALKCVDDHQLKNVRIFNGDARLLLEKLQNDSLDRLYVLFPDPWRKKKHHKRRLLSAQFISELTTKMTMDGVLTIATDHEDYMINILENLKENDDILYNAELSQLTRRPACLFPTKYEQKAAALGKQSYYIRIRRKY
ncbi:MAG: tRNA (guanosine(46)-N7)-methyltransferase TrmB [Holosporaceae bacterium]|nr:tRNA (guanosine(46)-N7)-methyltransferase TrmB [Holosporaceae bacterium]